MKVGVPRECQHVRELVPTKPLTQEFIAGPQGRILANSESFAPFPELPEIAFFPFEFWLFRYSLGPQKALEIYREILVPASTPLTDFWKEKRGGQT